MQKLRKQRPALFLLLACYTAGLAGLLLWHLGGFAVNRVLHANGTLFEQRLTLADCLLQNDLYPLEDGSLATIGPDPQLWLADVALRADSVEIEMQSAKEPLVITVFWAQPGQDHSIRRMAYGIPTTNGYRFELPATGGAQLRIDPDSTADNVVAITGITLNAPRSFLSFLRPSAGELFLLAVLPLLAASALSTLGRLLRLRKKGVKRRG